MSQLSDKAVLSVYATTKDCPLTHNQVLVYSYLLYQASYDSRPSFRKTAAKTGLSEHAVSNIVGELRDRHLVNDAGLAVLPGDYTHWFDEHGGMGEHVCRRLKFRRTYVLSDTPDNPLTVAAVSVYSFFWFAIRDGFRPRGGWSRNYVARVLALNAETVSDCLARLHTAGFLDYQDVPFGVQLESVLTERQVSYFADKAAFREDVEPGAVTFKAPPSVRTEVAPVVETKYNPELEGMLTFIDNHLEAAAGNDKRAMIDRVIAQLRRDGNVHEEKHWPEFAAYCEKELASFIAKRASTSEAP